MADVREMVALSLQVKTASGSHRISTQDRMRSECTGLSRLSSSQRNHQRISFLVIRSAAKDLVTIAADMLVGMA
jgi:hypothetical protein